jgi:hypothetical protein
MTPTHLLELLGISGIGTGHLAFKLTFDGAFSFSGFICLVVGTIQSIIPLLARSWPETTGKILSTQMVKSYSKKSGTTYHPDIEYEYQVNGVTYTHHRYAFGSAGLFTNYTTAEREKSKYRKGQSVSVYYNPLFPKDAVLEVRSASSWIFLLIGGVFFVVGMASTLLGLKL